MPFVPPGRRTPPSPSTSRFRNITHISPPGCISPRVPPSLGRVRRRIRDRTTPCTHPRATLPFRVSRSYAAMHRGLATSGGIRHRNSRYRRTSAFEIRIGDDVILVWNIFPPRGIVRRWGERHSPHRRISPARGTWTMGRRLWPAMGGGGGFPSRRGYITWRRARRACRRVRQWSTTGWRSHRRRAWPSRCRMTRHRSSRSSSSTYRDGDDGPRRGRDRRLATMPPTASYASNEGRGGRR